MSAVGAIVAMGGHPVSDVSLARMESALRLYGPDRCGRRAIGPAGLVSALMLGFTPEDAHERQPIDLGGRWHMVFAGWISNRLELLDTLGVEADRARTLPDSALVLKAWEKWRDAAPAQLDGNFCFIVWDKAEARLFAARSILFAPPLCYHQSRDRVAIATAPKGIFALGDVSPELDRQKIADSLVLNHADIERSYYRDISRLPLGCTLTIGSGRLEIARYYDPAEAPNVRFARDEEYVEAARAHLDRAVGEHLRAVETPAISLSSGLDSSAVAVTALGVIGNRDSLVSYTAIPEPGWDGRTFGKGWRGDESGPVRALGAMYPGLDLNFLDSAGAGPTASLDQLLLLAEAPPRNIGNLHWGIGIAKAARARGKRVMLDGAAGNGTLSLSGRARFPMLLKHGRLGELSRQLRADARPGQIAHGLFGKAILPLLPARMQQALRAIRGAAIPSDRRHWSAIHPAFAQAMTVDQRMAEAGFDAGFRPANNTRALVQQILFSGAFDEGQAVQHALQTLTGVQARSPLADRKLVDFCLGLPPEQLLDNGVDRRLIKRVIAGRIPQEILTAPRGRQAADWHARMTRDLASYRSEIARMAEDGEVAQQIDLDRLSRLIDDWPERTPLTAEDHPEYLMAYVGLARAIGTSRFVRWVNGANG